MKKTEDNKKTEQTKTPQSSSKCKEELIEEALGQYAKNNDLFIRQIQNTLKK